MMNRLTLLTILIYSCCLIPLQNSAQGLVNDNASIVITNGSNLILDGASGNYQSTNGGVISNYTPGGTIKIKGNWINNSSTSGFLNPGASVFFNGIDQFVTGNDTTQFYNMAISNTSLTLAGPHLIILNNVDFQVGRIYSSSLNTLEFGNTSTSTGATDSGYVDGPVSKTGNQAFEFPVGKNGRFRPIEISAPPLATDQFTAEYISEDPNQYYDVTRHDPSIDHVSRCEYWNLNRTAGTSPVYVTLSWNSDLCAVTVPGDLEVGRWDNVSSLWKDHGNGGTTGTSNSGSVVSSILINSFGPFALVSTSSQNPLPIKLIRFTASAIDSHVDLAWSTASEFNNSHFTIEKTINNYDFEKVKDISGAGNSAFVTNYSTVDEHPYKGISYYRLKQTDFDGKFFVSDLVKVVFNSRNHLSSHLYPNPAFSSDLKLSIDGSEGQEILISISDVSGKVIHSVSVIPTSQHSVFKLSGTNEFILAAGIYTVSVFGNNWSENNLVMLK